ncbi:AraC family transcriptional regulator [uncultured Prevotella sp.]|uniref:helix-turn-helix domain-containing protein n=1 Tax=uncultured Prevotella sp. TaxID=159272 RepID=UPI0025F34681|nr:AraC family transcriptional regulator [uncultured Prevotella sp.]
MDYSIYSLSLCIALPLMIFFGFYFLLARTPDKAIFGNYICSRRIMGVAMLLLAANYSVHFFYGIRFKNVNAAILMNMSTYFLCYWLFSSALTTLLNRFYITRRRLLTHIGLWVLFSVLSAIVLFHMPEGMIQKTGLLAMATWLMIYGFVLARRLVLAYRRAVKIFDNTHSDNIGAYIRWLSVFTYWAVVFGVGCGLLTFLPDKYIHVWILSSIPFYIYLFHCYQNYMLFYEKVENAMESEIVSEDDILCEADTAEDVANDMPSCYAEIAESIKRWIDDEGYLRPGLTIKELADTLHTNRTYLSGYINTSLNTTFRDWITRLRIDYAKQRMTSHPEQKIAEIAEASGFMSQSHFMKTFKDKEGCSPAKWKKAQKNIHNY